MLVAMATTHTMRVLMDSFTLKNMGPSSASQNPSAAVTHCMYSYNNNSNNKQQQYNNNSNNSSNSKNRFTTTTTPCVLLLCAVTLEVMMSS